MAGNAKLTLGSLISGPDPEMRMAAISQLMRMHAGNNPGSFLAQTDAIRGAREGNAAPQIFSALPDNYTQALADRFGWGADIADQSLVGPLALLPPVAYEGVKAAAPSLLKYMSFLPQGQEMAPSAKTSPASLDNIYALLAGYYSR
jgi:hypothetical protein